MERGSVAICKLNIRQPFHRTVAIVCLTIHRKNFGSRDVTVQNATGYKSTHK